VALNIEIVAFSMAASYDTNNFSTAALDKQILAHKKNRKYQILGIYNVL